MLRKFSHFFAWLLLVLMPLQAFAAANMLVCNSMMQVEASKQMAKEMPCHKHVNSAQDDKKSQQKSSCKTNCASLCASLNGMTALAQSTHTAPVLSADKILSAQAEIYASHTPPKLQRPPIFLA